LDPPILRRPDGLPVSYCAECALWYVSGIPPEQDIYALYQGYWFEHRPVELGERGAREVHEAAKATQASNLRLHRLVALLGTLKGKLVLEVGAGRGQFLLSVRHAGGEVIANEISSEACDFLEGALEIPVVRGELTLAGWDFESPDVIVMSDLIEHPIEPFKLLSRAVSLLKSGGRLLIWTPNGGAAGSDAPTARNWVGFRVDLEHLQYFSPRTMQVLAGIWGLHIDHLETTGYPELAGIDRLPAKKEGPPRRSLWAATKSLIKQSAPWIPQGRQIALEMRRPRVRGNYHLFAILRKP
jgi:2-polyprenyl-3-methyl-5-hydroxy-6-metoxy-1,4-benzoquinol methylase